MQTLILGLDAFDLTVFDQLSAWGSLPHVTRRYAESSGYARFDVTDPPQSRVLWTSIATGLKPGGSAPLPSHSDADGKTVEEGLNGHGYL